tara:strand:- start:403 stop:1182 length:780 start_codon:yes stop_codon:yes gene_type:complete
MPKKSLGQNFLNNASLLSNIVELGNISKNDVILEIGPGTGNLTEKILEKKPKKFYVVEKDDSLSKFLKNKFGDKIIIINDDILNCYSKFKFDTQIKVFGNLPYNISTKILISFIKLNDISKYFSKFIFIFQKEVADRLIAETNNKNYGRLSVITSWKMEKSKILDISPEFFYPIPKVWSTLLTLTPKSDFIKINQIKNLEHVTNIFFNQRRKMIGKPMKQLFKNYEITSKILNLDLKLRPQNIPVDKYLEICKTFEELI